MVASTANGGGSAVAHSRTWNVGGLPGISVVVSTYRRPEFLDELIKALTNQTLDHKHYEVIVVDNGSGDDTWLTLKDLVRSTSARMTVTSLATNRGPGGGRNHGISFVRAPLMLITDDDCLPTPGWLEAMKAAFEAGGDVLQGFVDSDPSDRAGAGPWTHTKVINQPTPFFETCNVGYRTAALRAVGGFDEKDALTAQIGGRAFGEDALLAWRVQEAGGTPMFVPDGLVYHRNIPGDFRHWLRGQRNLVGFPGLGNRSPLVAKWFWHRHFLAEETALFDLALLGVVGFLLTRRPLMGLLLVPYLRHRWPYALGKSNGERPLALARMAQLAVADGVSFASLAEGSIRHRRLVL
jgi:glycosyltransferase involved in cell wall biosynthesis